MRYIPRIIIKFKNYISHAFELIFNKNIIYPLKIHNKILKEFPTLKSHNYWNVVAKHILKASKLHNGDFFFLDKYVINHLASRNSSLGYKLVSKIYKDLNGKEYLSKVRTPYWGSPFILRRFPFLSSTTAAHLANLLSIEKCFKKKINQYESFLDFGGGYGGLAQCISQLSSTTKISILDIPEMIEVQKKYLSKTGGNNNIKFYNDLNFLLNSKFELFNASFSFSEVDLNKRSLIKKFIEKNCLRLHIIFQDSFNNIDNLSFFKKFANELRLKNWDVKLIEYYYYDWPNTRLLYAKNFNLLK